MRLAVTAGPGIPEALPWLLRLLAGQEIHAARLPIRFAPDVAQLQLDARKSPSAGGFTLRIHLQDDSHPPAVHLRWPRCCSAKQVARARSVLRAQLARLHGRTPPRRPLWKGSSFTRTDRDNELAAGLYWLLHRALRANAFDLSDYLQVFLILSYSARDPALRSLGKTVGPVLSRRYLRRAPRPRASHTAEQLFDHAAGLFFTRRFGVKASAAYVRAVRTAFQGASRRKLLTLKRKAPTARQLLDGLVDLYFPARLGLPTPMPYAKLLARARRFKFRYGSGENLKTLEDRTYLATHLIYVLSAFNHDALRTRDVAGIVAFLRRVALDYLVAGDVETLGEIADCLKITGHDLRDSLLRRIVTMILRKQNPDGSWGDPAARNEYDRYHTTWTAFNGLLEYRFNGRGPRDPVLRKAWLGR